MRSRIASLFVCAAAAVSTAIAQADWQTRLSAAQAVADQGRYRDAAALFQKIIDDTGGRDAGNGATALLLNRLGTVQQNLGEYAESERSFRGAVQILERVAGPAAEITASAQQNLADLYLELGRTDDAGPLLERVLIVRRRDPGADGVGLAEVLDAMGVMRILQGKPGAAALIREALATLSAHHSEDTQAFAIATMHLASQLGTQGRHRQALPIARRAVDLMQATSLATPGDRLSSLAILAAIESKAAPASAEGTIRKALAEAEAAYGADHPRTGWVLLTYVNILRNLHRAAEAGPMQERADQILAGFKANQQSITAGSIAVRSH